MPQIWDILDREEIMLLPDIVNSPEHGDAVRAFVKKQRENPILHAETPTGIRKTRKKLHALLKVKIED